MPSAILNAIPSIITGPGEYVTRNGFRATVHEVAPEGDPTTTAFRAKGSVWRMYRGKMRPRGYAIWHVSGRGFPLRESGNDIVGKWNGGQ